MTVRDPCTCCAKPLEPNVLAGNMCRECFDHYPNPHGGGRESGGVDAVESKATHDLKGVSEPAAANPASVILRPHP